MWKCKCECGKECVANSMLMRAKKKRSCGCLYQQMLADGRKKLLEKQRTHGKSGTREHHIWLNIIYRCESESCGQYFRYGGRGIRICQGWRHSFETFINDLGYPPSKKHTVERKDNDGNYSCGKCKECIQNKWQANCEWNTRKAQANNRRSNKVFEYKGQKRNVTQLAEEFGIDRQLIFDRLRRGWSIADAIERPVRIECRPR